MLPFTCTASVSFMYLQEIEIVLPSNAKYFSWLHFYIQMLVISLLRAVQYRFFTLSNLSPEGSVRRFLLNAAALNFLAKARALGAICDKRRAWLKVAEEQYNSKAKPLTGDGEETCLEGSGYVPCRTICCRTGEEARSRRPPEKKLHWAASCRSRSGARRRGWRNVRKEAELDGGGGGVAAEESE